MTFIISIAAAILFILLCRTRLKKDPVPFYWVFTGLSLAAVLLVWSGIKLPGFVNGYVLPVIARGGLAGALFVIVMIAGALPNGSNMIKVLMPIRGELSIIASIMTIGHNLAYGKTYFVYLFVNPDVLPVTQKLAAICSLIMIVIMLPLFITSFKSVRKKMNGKHWKKLQRLAYIFYGLLCAHIMLLCVPNAMEGRSGYLLTVIIYGTIFSTYFVCRIMKELAVKKHTMNSLAKREAVCAVCASVLCTAIACGSVHMTGRADNTAAQNENEAGKTEESESMPLSESSVPEQATVYKDGVYTGSAMGNSGQITVEIEMKDDKIQYVQIVSQKEDEPYWTWATEVIDDILEAGSFQVDTVSGATYSSGGIIDAVKKAMEQAKN